MKYQNRTQVINYLIQLPTFVGNSAIESTTLLPSYALMRFSIYSFHRYLWSIYHVHDNMIGAGDAEL